MEKLDMFRTFIIYFFIIYSFFFYWHLSRHLLLISLFFLILLPKAPQYIAVHSTGRSFWLCYVGRRLNMA